ncbi:hypothetical protein [Cronobacter turicensis]|uniref:hypothetical protein n=1 Tax=Cronobacter turicensis TaxID=413502 RepID=UPI0024C2E435|nr:hypothetical protein [Cronobacter turicensis]MDK1186426.1 hypothetical protein [Cronobacter turicensis]MDK1206679.1 hypothetical protein [Cronobacter turicensis]MDK1213978.1 hypothetical protein [Cronobacter turicensis]MDK1220599.1 hypothetical protein [Cronobacter turicensis]MDK1230530.1 hypothetical protein [Cronobacter turicensis]
MSLKPFLTGSRFYQLITYSAGVDDDIAHRRLHQLKLKMAQQRELPKARFIGTSSFYHVLVGSNYLMLFSAALNVAALRPPFAPLWVFGGVLWLILLMVIAFMVEKGRRSGLVLLLYSWFFHLALSVVALCVGLARWPFSWGFWLCWGGGALLIWLAWRMMNSQEMFRLVHWCLAIKMHRVHTKELQRPSEKRAVKRRKKS